MSELREPDPDSGSAPAEMELSLSELGRAYARATGQFPEEPDGAEPADELPADDGNCEVSPSSILEAILFVGTTDPDAPLATRQIASWIRDVSPREIGELARRLNHQYEKEGAAYRVECRDGRVAMVLAPEFHPLREGFYGEVRKVRLSQQAIDVLSVVAWMQPISRDRISELRHRDCGSVLTQLVRRGLLDAEPDPDPAKARSGARVYRTSKRFLELFGLESLDDLPQSAESLLPDADIE